MAATEIKDLAAEGGIVASIINHPEFAFHSEQLKPEHFYDKQNAAIYTALVELARRGIEKIDTYNLATAIHANAGLEDVPVSILNDYVDMGQCMARNTVEEYRLVVDTVLDKAFRRDILRKLRSCENMCETGTGHNIQEQIYKTLDDTMMAYSTADDAPQYKDVIDGIWDKIVADQTPDRTGAMFKFSRFNEYVTIDPGEFVIFAAEAKRGKSIMLLNCAVDLLDKGKSVLYIDSELSTKVFTLRLLAHLTGIPYSKIKWGRYSEEEHQHVISAIAKIKTWNFTHIYLPRLDDKTIYSITKKTKHTRGVDVLILDYLKSKRDGDAYATYQEMGRIADLIKNILCGDMGIAGLGAVQLTSKGTVADSANIERSASTIIKLLNKTQNEIDADGKACGNYKAVISLNRNGGQMLDGEYIDLFFDGNTILFEQAQQHVSQEPV